MGHAEKHLPGLGILLLDVGFDGIGQGGVACFVALHDFARGFVDDDDVVVFVEYFHSAMACAARGSHGVRVSRHMKTAKVITATGRRGHDLCRVCCLRG